MSPSSMPVTQGNGCYLEFQMCATVFKASPSYYAPSLYACLLTSYSHLFFVIFFTSYSGFYYHYACVPKCSVVGFLSVCMFMQCKFI